MSGYATWARPLDSDPPLSQGANPPADLARLPSPKDGGFPYSGGEAKIVSTAPSSSCSV